MPKIRIKYATKSEIPEGFAEYYSPVDQAEPDGPHLFTGFESDPDGMSLANVAQLQRQIKTLQADKARADSRLKSFRKADDNDELWSPEEIANAMSELETLRETAGKAPNQDELRKQVATELSSKHEQAIRALQAQLEKANKGRDHWLETYKKAIRMNAATSGLGDLKAKEGLHDIAVGRFAEEIDLEEITAEGQDFPTFEPRVRGQNGYRLDGNGNPISPSEYAKGDFAKQYAEMFEPRDRRTGTGANPDPKPAPGGGSGKGSGRFTMKQSDMLADSSQYQKVLKSVPQNDFLQILGDDGSTIVGVKPGEAAPASS